MKTDALDRSVYLLSYWVHTDEQVIDDILDPEKDLIRELDYALEIELEDNLSSKETTGGKIDVLRRYLYAFMEVQGFFKMHKVLILTGIHSGTYADRQFQESSTSEAIKLNRFQCYILSCHELYTFILDSIQHACFQYRIDLFQLLEQLDIDPIFIDYVQFTDYKEIEFIRDKQANTSNRKKQHMKSISNNGVVGNLKGSGQTQAETGSEDNDEIIGKPFESYIRHEQRKEIARICKEIFAQDYSPKNYAIMFGILSESRLIFIPDKARKPIYLSWYIFIAQKLPEDPSRKINEFLSYNKDQSCLTFHEQGNSTDRDNRQAKKLFFLTLKRQKIKL